MMTNNVIFGLKIEVVSRIINVFRNYPELEEAIIYGSRAKGNYRPGSDIDMTFKGSNLTISIINTMKLELDDLLLPYTFDFSIYHQISNQEFINHIHRIGKPFYISNKNTTDKSE